MYIYIYEQIHKNGYSEKVMYENMLVTQKSQEFGNNFRDDAS